jgi:hypothetical protein
MDSPFLSPWRRIDRRHRSCRIIVTAGLPAAAGAIAWAWVVAPKATLSVRQNANVNTGK